MTVRQIKLAVAALALAGPAYAQTLYNPNGTVTGGGYVQGGGQYPNTPPANYGQGGTQPAQNAGYANPPQASPQPTLLAPEQLDGILGRIALYPDSLLAQIVVASTTPLDVVAANQYATLYPNNSDAQLDAQPWSPAVKTLVRYPSVISMLAGDVSYTQALGNAYAVQPADVMNAVQRLRAQAQLSGALYPTPQQQVVLSNGIIQILPVQEQTVYVPVYDPRVVYVVQPLPVREAVRFGPPCEITRDFYFSFDWSTRRVIHPAPAPRHVVSPGPYYGPYYREPWGRRPDSWRPDNQRPDDRGWSGRGNDGRDDRHDDRRDDRGGKDDRDNSRKWDHDRRDLKDDGPKGVTPRGDGPKSDVPKGDGPSGGGPKGDGPKRDNPRNDSPRTGGSVTRDDTPKRNAPNPPAGNSGGARLTPPGNPNARGGGNPSKDAPAAPSNRNAKGGDNGSKGSDKGGERKPDRDRK